jgi:hypothetical protein
MEAKELVGKWIVTDTVARALNVPADTAFKVVGFVLDLNFVIVDAGRLGWKGLESDDFVVEQCETYKYVYLYDIIEVL